MTKTKCSKQQAGGNTASPACFRYCFTLNNYSNVEIENVLKFCKENCKSWIFGKEIGENQTPHLQGFFKLKKKMRITEFKTIPGILRAHFEKCKGTDQENITYCSKDGDYFKSDDIKVKSKLIIIKDLRPWQEQLKTMLMGKPDDRTIIWIYDLVGNSGKTCFLKYMVHTYGCIFTTGGKNADIINLIFNEKDYMLSDNAIVMWNLPRTISKEYISYQAIESIKDGLICNNKFECGSFCCNSPHVVIFTNIYPKVESLSKDRWKIFSIENNELIKIEDDLFIVDEDF